MSLREVPQAIYKRYKKFHFKKRLKNTDVAECSGLFVKLSTEASVCRVGLWLYLIVQPCCCLFGYIAWR